MHILVENSQELITIDNKFEKMIESAVEFALKEEGFQNNIELNFYFVKNETIKEINKQQRNIDKVTDVLSFPMTDTLRGKLIGEEWDKNPETGCLILGDIIISTQRAMEQAADYGHSLQREIMFLVTHGLYHILGYDHMTEADEAEMMEKQEKVLSMMGILRG